MSLLVWVYPSFLFHATNIGVCAQLECLAISSSLSISQVIILVMYECAIFLFQILMTLPVILYRPFHLFYHISARLKRLGCQHVRDM